ncbi:hypothetical protein EL22_13975 [Halostagnicola sp. A56]|uniref:hypothetical protein n=1 Tax=Halostagnicola sp. A56 TaxID=1495067 RepID=UPI0004A026F5|nr:hypothetical protein [Halostagnicola sp. A56]KDE57233.1 hypothetical protein EL22_13975 [Halostagnicola sp. A56]
MDRKSVLLGVAVVLAGYSAFLHFGVGLAGVLGSVPDGAVTAVSALFLISAVVVGFFLVALARGVAIPTIYLAGGVLMVLHLVAYVDVHALGYFETATGVDMHGHDGGSENHSHDDTTTNHSHDDGAVDHSHADDTDGHSHDDGTDGHTHADDENEHAHGSDESTGQILVSHLRNDLTALSTKIAETGSAIAFFALYVLER